jgi:hypothetical protein
LGLTTVALIASSACNFQSPAEANGGLHGSDHRPHARADVA